METTMIILSVIFAGFAVSYGWGVRGFVIGGEKGALLPGALMGLSVSIFCLGELNSEYFLFFAAAGALSMFYGGTETYAQTMSFLLSRDVKGPFYGQLKKGVAGIFLKGGIWFSIPGFVLAMLVSALSGAYKMYEIIILFALFPIVSFIGTKLINTPYDREKKIFPKLYFSLDRREEWGGNVFIILLLLIFCLVKGDFFSAIAGIYGFLVGGIGFLLGLIFYDIELRSYGKNKRRVFGKLSEKGYIDGWKIMEHTFGAFSGGGLMLFFALSSDRIKTLIGNADLSKLALGNDTVIFAIVPFIMLLITAIQYPIQKKAEKEDGKFPEVYIFELLERPFWSCIPLIFIFLGAKTAAACCAFMTVGYALCEKCALEWYEISEYKKIIRSLFALLLPVITVWFYFSYQNISVFDLMMLYAVAYTAACAIWSFLPDRFKEVRSGKKSAASAFGGGITVTGHLIIQSAVLVIISLIIS